MWGGAVDAYFATLHRKLNIMGVDLVDHSFWMLNEFATDDIKSRVKLEIGDWYCLNTEYVNAFDGVISVQTLSFLEEWKKPLEKIVDLNPKWIGLSSLFYEGKIDFKVKVTDYNNETVKHYYYNVYPLPIIKEYLVQRGYSLFKYSPFEIDIDIPKPNHSGMETYTVKTDDGRRLQISGGLLMPWYFIYAAKE